MLLNKENLNYSLQCSAPNTHTHDTHTYTHSQFDRGYIRIWAGARRENIKSNTLFGSFWGGGVLWYSPLRMAREFV